MVALRRESPKAIAVVMLVAAALQSQPLLAAAVADELEQRPEVLPRLGDKDECPISVGTRGAVPEQQHIFWNPLWFGAGPVYFALAWKASSDDKATFALEPVPIVQGARYAKTPWVAAPSYSGPILIRGRALHASGTDLRFGAGGMDNATRLKLTAPNAPSPGLWSFWPSSMWVPGPGCYGVQIDTLDGTEIVVFEAT